MKKPISESTAKSDAHVHCHDQSTVRGHTPESAGVYTCPMHPEVRQKGPGHCPKCGMALEPLAQPSSGMKTEYVCPMHAEIIRGEPGDCPICGMALEARGVAMEEENQELNDMTRRFWVSVLLALPVFVMAMVHDLAPRLMPEFVSTRPLQWAAGPPSSTAV